MKQEATINGLMDGVSVVETDNKRYEYYEAVAKTDILYNDREPIEKAFQDLYREEGFTVSEYDPELFNESINLLSVKEDVRINRDWSDNLDSL